MLSFQSSEWRVFWKSTLSRLLFSIEMFLGIYELEPSLMLKIKLIWSVRSSAISNKTNFFKYFIGGSSLLDLQPTRLLISACLLVWVHALVLCPATFRIRLLWHKCLNRKNTRIHYKNNSKFCKTCDFKF